MKVFIELWKAKDTWKQLTIEQRQEYVAKMGPVMQGLVAKGITFDSWGINTDSTPQKMDYDFFAVTKVESEDLLKTLQEVVEGFGWYDYFEQVNVSGDNIGPEGVMSKMLTL